MKLRPWFEWKAKTRDWLVGIRVHLTFAELARMFQSRKARRHSRKQPPEQP